MNDTSKACASVGASPDVFFPCVDDKDNERLSRIEALMNTTFDGKEVPQVWFKRADVLRIVSAAVGASVQPVPVAYSEGRTLHWHAGRGITDAQLYAGPVQPANKPVDTKR